MRSTDSIWESFTSKTDSELFKTATVLWRGDANEQSRIPKPPYELKDDQHYVILRRILNHQLILFTIAKGKELNAVKGKEFFPQAVGYTARLEF